MQILNIKNHTKKINWKLIITESLLLAFVFVPSAHAQEVSIGIYPPISQIEAQAPADIKSPVYLENPTDNPIELGISYKAFVPSLSQNGQLEYLNDLQSLPDAEFVKKVYILDKNNPIKSITLSPKQKKNLMLEILLPENQPKGDYYFSVIFSSKPKIINQSNSSMQTVSVAMNVLLTVGPKGKTSGIIESFSAPLFVDKGPVAFTVAIKNTSEHFINPTGEIIIKNLFGQPIGKVELVPVNILANSTRRIPDEIQTGNDKKQLEKIKSVLEKNEFPVAIWPENFLIGPYNSTLTISLSDDGPVFKKSIMFFAFPLTYLIGLIIIFGITVFIILRVKKKIE